jgi:hypothetical protein
VIVEDVKDFRPQRSPLDPFFLPIDKIAQDDEKLLRMAQVWVRDENKYVEKVTMPFGKWMKQKRYTIVMTS